MRTTERTTRFKRDHRREKRSDPRLDEKLLPLVRLLANDEPVPQRFADHPLTGRWAGCRDCHVRPDLVLIYIKPSPDVLQLLRLGSHSELFG